MRGALAPPHNARVRPERNHIGIACAPARPHREVHGACTSVDGGAAQAPSCGVGRSSSAVLTVLSLQLAAGCGFDSGGIATASNGSGPLDSGGTSSSGDGMTTMSASAESTVGTTVGTTASSTMTTDDVTGDPPSTTLDPSETSATSTETTATSESSDSGPSESSSSGDGTTGAEDSHYYRNCTPETEAADCGPDPSYCQGFVLDDSSTGYVCYVTCDLGPCPPPPTGNATPGCNVNNFCVLDCEGGLTCPDGMICDYSISFDGYRCVWP